MKKKIVLIVVIIVLVAVALFCLVNKTEDSEIVQESSAEVVKYEPVEWHGNYIWDSTNINNTWMCFRKTFNVSKKDLNNIKAQIAVDSKYWLYINGELVVREGGLKRGETKDSIYYDEIDITKYLVKGQNTIAILAWYWGGESYSHNSSGQAGMMFQAKIGDNYLIANETWKVHKAEAYLQDELRPNNRLIEYNVYYDASLADEDWYKTDYDDSQWENATVLNIAGSLPWGEMIERPIPQFKDYGLKEYENMSEYSEYTTESDEKIEMIIPYNAQFTPYLKLEAEAGKKIVIKTDCYEDINGDSVKCTYLTKDGIQEFESFAWMNGEKVYYEIPSGVKIISLGYRQTGYDTQMTGSFESDDEFFNKLWQMANRTLYVNMRDSYMDCPNRERAQWWGDVSMEMMQAMYALDTNTYPLYEKGVKTTIGWRYENVLPTVAPITDGYLHLPTQMLAGINSMYEYYEYTGKKEILAYAYPYLKNYINLWYVKEENGLVHSSVAYPIWEWGDSSGNVDYEALENAWYYLALSKLNQMAKILEYNEDINDFESRLENLKINFNKLWTDKGYKTNDCKYVDERVNAIAVISGLAEQDKYEEITKILTTSYESTPYMEKYILQALCEMGKINEAQERIKYRYDEMVNGENSCSTLWESWSPEAGTKNHAWSGGPLIIMSKYFAGIEPLENGYEVISIKPQFGNLNKISSKVTTIKGEISLSADKTENILELNLNVPAKTRVAVEKMSENPQISVNGKKVYKDGETKNNNILEYSDEDDNYVYFYMKKGDVRIISE